MNKEETIQQKLIDKIAEAYGFQPDKILNPKRDGDRVLFSVNGIHYSGELNYHNAFSTLNVEGYSIPEDIKEREDNCYNTYLRHEKVILLMQNVNGDWEDTGIRFNTPQEAEEWIQLSNTKYTYMCKPEGSCRKD